MAENKKYYENWPGLVEYTKEFKEWIWKLFRKVHARIGHVEEELAHVRETSKSDYKLLDKGIQPDGTYIYELVEGVTGTSHGSISINTSGEIQVVKWYNANGTNEQVGNALSKVLHWTGSSSEWTTLINSHRWDDYIVFAKVEENGSSVKHLWAGNKDFVYDEGSVYWDNDINESLL